MSGLQDEQQNGYQRGYQSGYQSGYWNGYRNNNDEDGRGTTPDEDIHRNDSYDSQRKDDQSSCQRDVRREYRPTTLASRDDDEDGNHSARRKSSAESGRTSVRDSPDKNKLAEKMKKLDLHSIVEDELGPPCLNESYNVIRKESRIRKWSVRINPASIENFRLANVPDWEDQVVRWLGAVIDAAQSEGQGMQSCAMSKMYLTDKEFGRICVGFQRDEIFIPDLYFDHNKITSEGMDFLIGYLKTCPMPLRELHLSHNYIGCDGALRLLEVFLNSDAEMVDGEVIYPARTPGCDLLEPVYIRLEYNSFRKAALAPKIQSQVCDCYQTKNQRGGCGTNYCKYANDNYPALHIPMWDSGQGY
jgi:hypothetical protein